MVTKQSMEEQVSRLSIPHGMWIAMWEAEPEGTFITTGNSHAEALEAAKRMGAPDTVTIAQNVSGKACELNSWRI